MDLYQLWLAGHSYLPDVAARFSAAVAELNRAGEGDGAFVRPPGLGWGYGPMWPPLYELRELLIDMLVDTSAALHDAGAALVLAANRYAEADTLARDTFNDIRRREAHEGA